MRNHVTVAVVPLCVRIAIPHVAVVMVAAVPVVACAAPLWGFCLLGLALGGGALLCHAAMRAGAVDGLSIGGYTVHSNGNAYCGSWTSDAGGATVAGIPAKVVRKGDFVGVVAEREENAIKAAAQLKPQPI